MLPFILGALSFWAVMGVFALVGESFGWNDGDWYYVILSLPLFVICSPFLFVFFVLVHPWRNVFKPVPKERFDTVKELGEGKFFKITERFYLCVDFKHTKVWNSVFFVRIKNESNF